MNATTTNAGKTLLMKTASEWLISVRDSRWWSFFVAITGLKIGVLALDPEPKIYPGDSFSYIWTAISGWIPDDRSFAYGFLIRWSSLWNGSLTSLVIIQTFLGAVIAAIVAWICWAIFKLPSRISYLFGILCAIDPLQLAWERYVMTETCSLFFYALVLQQSFTYLRDRRVITLLIIQILSLITIGFRMSYLISIQVMAVLLPIIAFMGEVNATSPLSISCLWRSFQFLKRPLFWKHLAASVIALFVLDQVYQHTYGFLSRREPAHLHGTGYFLLAIWAPVLQPQDATDPRLAEIIIHGDDFGLREADLRNAQRFEPNGLVARWCRIETDPQKSSEIAASTAFNAFRRNPAGVISLGMKTYLAYWSGHSIRKIARSDLKLKLPPRVQENGFKILAEQFHWAYRSQQQSLTSLYYIAASPWFFIILASPLLSLVLLAVAQNKRYALFLFSHATVLLSSTFLLSLYPVPRFLQPLSLLTLLTLALVIKSWVCSGTISQTD